MGVQPPTRVLIIPAAGRGSRLGWDGPKALCPVAGKPMIDHLLERYASVVDRIVVVVSPAAAPAFERHFRTAGRAVECVAQPEPTGMLPAVLCARPAVETQRPDEVWITWCDQIGISAPTVRRLVEALDGDPGAALVFPTVRQAPPYIHFVRDAAGRIAGVLQRRDGDAMPDAGESDAGLFAMRRDGYLRDLVEYDRLAPAAAGARERNFLPFIPWLAGRATVRTVDLGDAREAVGVNTPDDLRAVEAYLRERA
jgi:bifunctional N-acetylglucosamine-1-phosphate-uridyltransferase/glucosamine-1-phosphate-acetyltransferase GlmU-like protein